MKNKLTVAEQLSQEPRFIELVNEGTKYTELTYQYQSYSKSAVWRAQQIIKSAARLTQPRALAAAESDDLQNTSDNGKKRDVNWRELCHAATAMQDVVKRCSMSNEFVTWSAPDAEKPIGIIPFGDAHWGSYGTDHNLIEQFTDDVLSLPRTYIIAMGDLEHMAIKLRGVKECMDNVLPPNVQHAFTESWMDEIGHRVIAATWDNHSVEREETQGGTSLYAEIMARRVPYFGGIGHLDVQVGEQVYKMAISHKWRGRSAMNPLAGQMRYMRFEGQDREICIGADSHVPGSMHYADGGRARVAVNCGTTQLNSGFGSRYFSLYTLAAFPILVLWPDSHRVESLWSIEAYTDLMQSYE